MGAYLDTPVTEKVREDGKNSFCSWGACSMQGWRCGMEDSHIAIPLKTEDGKDAMLFGVFDGHGGKEVANFARDEFKDVLLAQPEWKHSDYEMALQKAFLQLDSKVQEQKEYANDTGTTACVVLITDKDIYCSNAGDSRGVLSNNGNVVELSQDHKPDNVGEMRRIEKANHYVEDSRVDGNLALSRAFGDFQYKDQSDLDPKDQAVTSFPEIKKIERSPGSDKFIILACDGIWDCLKNEECIQLLDMKLKSKSDKSASSNVHSEIVAEMFDQILAPNTDDGIGTDNMTAILINFEKK